MGVRKPLGARPEQYHKPEQYASTKAGFVAGRNVWSGTAERRANAAIAAAKAATGEFRRA